MHKVNYFRNEWINECLFFFFNILKLNLHVQLSFFLILFCSQENWKSEYIGEITDLSVE